MPYRQLYFSGTRLLGEASRGPVCIGGEWSAPCSYLWVCRYCGEIYQRAPVLLPSGEVMDWLPIMDTCSRCAPRCLSQFLYPGTFYLPLRSEFNDALPVPVLLHDYLAYDRHFRRFHP